MRSNLSRPHKFTSIWSLATLGILVMVLVFLGFHHLIHPHASGQPGDVNGDGRVDVLDLSILAANYAKTSATAAQGDLNGDGRVDVFDLSILAANWSHSMQPPASKPVFAYYYMWWDNHHWTSHLGTSYPYTQQPNPLPATLDANGCGTATTYPGNVETDISQNLAYDQTNPQVIKNDVEQAAATGLAGFAVNWIGDGTTSQAASWAYNQRLAAMMTAVHQVNAEGKPFKLILNYQSSAKILTMTQFTNDLNYLFTTYGSDAALDHTYSSKPEIILAGTWKYTDANIDTISQAFRGRMYLLGDEKPASWDATRTNDFDGATYYWSSQDPYANPASFTQLKNFAATIRSTKNPNGTTKTWLSPFIAGYNGMLVYGTPTCVPRNNGQTATTVYDGNLATNPDGWAFISWNEITEGTYIVPLTRYGTQYTSILKTIIQTGR